MTFIDYRNKLEQEQKILQEYFPYCENGAQAVMLMERVTVLKQEIKVLGLMTYDQALQPIESVTVDLESKMNFEIGL